MYYVSVDKEKNTCTVRMIADHVFYGNVGQEQESTVSLMLEMMILNQI